MITDTENIIISLQGSAFSLSADMAYFHILTY